MSNFKTVHTIHPATSAVDIRNLIYLLDGFAQRQRMHVANVVVASVKSDLQPIILLCVHNSLIEA